MTFIPYRTVRQKTPVKKYRSKPRPGRVKGKKMAALRSEVFTRDGESCTRCGKFVGQEGHLAHKKAKRRHGDSPENTHVLCADCHRLEHQYGPSGVKPCPRKDGGISLQEGGNNG
jgi:5-methylcytosine-specific restriction endonuclease McrA